MIKIIVDSEQECCDLIELFSKAMIIIHKNGEISEPQKLYMQMAFENLANGIEVEGRR
jgi:hypothetical protein